MLEVSWLRKYVWQVLYTIVILLVAVYRSPSSVPVHDLRMQIRERCTPNAVALKNTPVFWLS